MGDVKVQMYFIIHTNDHTSSPFFKCQLYNCRNIEMKEVKTN